MEYPWLLSVGRKWAVFVGCCILCIFGFALPLLCFGVFVSPLVGHFGSSVTDVNLYFTFMTAAAVISCACGARLIERSSRGTILLSSTGISLAYIALALFPSVPLVWIAGLVAGLCYPLCSSIVVPILINQWFDKDQTTLTGVAFALVGATGVVAGPVLTSAIGFAGWQAVLAVMGGAILCANGLAAVFLIRDCRSSALVAARDEAGNAGDVRARPQFVSSLSSDYRPKVFAGIFLAFATAATLSGFLGVFNTQVNTVVQKSGFSPMVAGVAFSCTSVGLFVGKILLGWLRDHFGAVKAIGLGCIAGLVAFMLIFLALVSDVVWVLYVGCAIGGLCTCLGTIGPALLAGGTFGPDRYDRAVSSATAFVNVGMAVGAPIYSVCFDASGSFLGVVIASAAVSLMTLFAGMASICMGGDGEGEVVLG